MLKKLSTLALVAMIALPTTAFAGSGSDDLAAKIDQLSQELTKLRQEMAQLKDDTQESAANIEERAENWDLASRIQFSGDFRARLDSVSADTKAYYTASDVANTMFANAASVINGGGPGAAPTAAALGGFFAAPADQRGAMLPGFAPFMAGTPITPAQDYGNDTNLTNRFRLNMRVKATEYMEFKGRLAMYKAWGMQNNPLGQDPFGPYTLNSMSFDGSTTRQPGDSALYVDRAFMNWNNIGGQPIWFSIGRRPTTDGPPAQLRLGADKKMATPTAVMDYPFDGLSVGYAYNSLFGMQDFPGRIRFCYGRGFEAGPSADDAGLNDVDFAGVSWDIYNKGDRFLTFQSFAAVNMFNVPDNVAFPNPLEIAVKDNLPTMSPSNGDQLNDLIDLANINAGAADGILDRANLGNIYHTSLVYMAKYSNFNYFITGGWSRTNPTGWDEAGNSLLTSWWGDLEDKDGYEIYIGGRYDIPELGIKLGLEYNHGSKDWISFTPGNDDLYASKLATRGDVYEAYGIWDIPSGEILSKFGKAFIRIGYQHFEYDYTGSGFWVGEPADMDQLTDSPLNAQLYAPTDSMDQVYLSMETWF